VGSSPLERLGAFLAELRRRKVYQVTAIYTVLAIGGLELASVLLPATRLPDWFDELFVGLAIVGLPLVLVLAWTFDITEGGIERTPDAPGTRGEEQGSAPVAEVASDAPAGPAASGLDPLAVAVLPFENLSGTEEAKPFAAGLHDDLLTELSRASALTVISRTSVKGYAGSEKSIREIAAELGVGTVVEGGVQQAGSRVRLNVQLIDARTDGHLWAERYDRELTAENIFELQSELSRRIMAELHAKLTVDERAQERERPTGDLEAWRLYSTGRDVSIDRSEEGFRAAVKLYDRAIERDPAYALAWAGLGDALVGLVDYGHARPDEAEEMLRRGEEACHRALKLDPELAEAYSALGRLHTALRDAPSSMASHARAIELRPGYAGGYQWSCWASLLLNDGPAAVDTGTQATRLDPLDPEAAGNLAAAKLMIGDTQGALSETDRILSHHPAFEWALWVRGLALQALGRDADAVETMGRLEDRWTRGWFDVVRGATGAADLDDMRGAAERLEGLGLPFKTGILKATLGDLDGAFGAVRAAWPLPWDESLYLYVHGAAPVDAMRADPRFASLLEDVVKSWRSPGG
jgi:TolB-like protein